MLLADGGFHKRTCFVAPNMNPGVREHRHFNYFISKARVIVECCIGLLKMKWCRLHHHLIEERTEVIANYILAACILHNICIDAGDVNAEEDAAERDPEETAADKAAIRAAYGHVLAGDQALMSEDAEARVAQADEKMREIFAFWSALQEDGAFIHMEDLRGAFGEAAFKFDDAIIDDSD